MGWHRYVRLNIDNVKIKLAKICRKQENLILICKHQSAYRLLPKTPANMGTYLTRPIVIPRDYLKNKLIGISSKELETGILQRDAKGAIAVLVRKETIHVTNSRIRLQPISIAKLKTIILYTYMIKLRRTSLLQLVYELEIQIALNCVQQVFLFLKTNRHLQETLNDHEVEEEGGLVVPKRPLLNVATTMASLSQILLIGGIPPPGRKDALNCKENSKTWIVALLILPNVSMPSASASCL